ncbi:hypothetical protein GMORB2_3078 [Geosmithia morbida]|uniref:RNase MRP protein 1 RNA binding domain-containing protein n=1 Tax=Geosmithia morbida TaxID=1094350 RepID=A0A9P4YR34_9HYPO|nr:uncharacterized protein GMORB2_3078 [Geosmithia morbida]KAF4120277.1 hypothetical protein GMORB2_3078 [Geosmithia morbida]
MPTITPEAAITIHTYLAPLLPIVDAFNHRHKNQHRSSHWWSHFSIFRRSLRSLVISLTLSSRRSHNGDSSFVFARWLTQRIIPRVYIPFTQLAADNQHAPLGLLLFTLLARVGSVLSQHVPADDDVPTASAVAVPKPKRDQATTNISAETDRGIVISRGDLPPPVNVTQPTSAPAHSGKQKRTKTAPPSLPTKPRNKSKSKKSQKGDDFSSLFGSL